MFCWCFYIFIYFIFKTILPHLSINMLKSYPDSGSIVLEPVEACFANFLKLLHKINNEQITWLTFSSCWWLTRLYFHSSMLAGLLVYLVHWLELLLNVAAWLTYHLCRSNQSPTLLQGLHWLSATECIKFWLAVLVFRCRNNTARCIWQEICTGLLTTTPDNVCNHQPPTSWSCHVHDSAPLATEHSELLQLMYGTMCHSPSALWLLWTPSRDILRHISFTLHDTATDILLLTV